MMKHAKYPPSSAHRWLKCTASPGMEKGKDSNPTPASAAGTFYHAVADEVLGSLLSTGETRPDPADVDGLVGEYFDIVHDDPGSYMGGRDIDLAVEHADRDTCVDFVSPYVVAALGLVKDADNARSEGKVYPLPGLDKVLFGTVDFHAVEDGVVHVVDLKTGRHPVSPDWNPQLMLYALGVLQEYDVRAREVRLYIHQGGELKGPWSCDPGDLVDFSVEVSRAIKSSMIGGQFAAGDHCRWCGGRTECSAYADRARVLAAEEFDVPVTGGEIDTAAVQATLENMAGEQLADLYDKFALVSSMMDTVHEVATRRAYEEGLTVPGYKLVRGVKHKTWTDGAKVAEVLGEGAYKKQLLTPAQAIKAFGEDDVAGLWHVPEGDLKLVPVADKGTPVAPAALAEFDKTEETERTEK